MAFEPRIVKVIDIVNIVIGKKVSTLINNVIIGLWF